MKISTPERENETNGSASDRDGDDVMRLWRIVDGLTADLSDADCRAVYTAIATGVADGWRPTDAEVASLVDFAKQQAIAAPNRPDAREPKRGRDSR